MWDRALLKENGKLAFKQNYWPAVLAGLLMLIAGQGISILLNVTNVSGDLDAILQAAEDNPELAAAALRVLIPLIGRVMLIGFLLKVFVFNPLLVGGRRFFFENSRYPASFNEILYAFRTNYLNTLLTMLLTDLFLILWTLIPIVGVFVGFVKSYSYRLVPTILAEDPNTSPTEAITLSRQMMDGQKWDTWIFDLSFIGWVFLSVLTFGIVGIFYYVPYFYASDAELYKAIVGGSILVTEEPESNSYYAG